MRAAADRVGLTGSRQYPLALKLEQEGYKVSHCVVVGVEALAKELGVIEKKSGRPDRCNTKKRCHNLQDRYGLITIVQGGGRRRGCNRGDGIVGLANRAYPGPQLMAPQIVARWIAEDNERELAKPGQWTYPPRRLELQRQVDEYHAGEQLLEQTRAGP